MLLGLSCMLEKNINVLFVCIRLVGCSSGQQVNLYVAPNINYFSMCVCIRISIFFDQFAFFGRQYRGIGHCADTQHACIG